MKRVLLTEILRLQCCVLFMNAMYSLWTALHYGRRVVLDLVILESGPAY